MGPGPSSIPLTHCAHAAPSSHAILQGFFIAICSAAGLVKSAEEGVNIQNFLLCMEMLPAAICMLFAFPYAPYVVAGGGLSGGNVTHAISIRWGCRSVCFEGLGEDGEKGSCGASTAYPRHVPEISLSGDMPLTIIAAGVQTSALAACTGFEMWLQPMLQPHPSLLLQPRFAPSGLGCRACASSSSLAPTPSLQGHGDGHGAPVRARLPQLRALL